MWGLQGYAMQELNVSTLISERLIDLDQNGGLVPVLATSWKQLDDVTIQLDLRQNVKFTNGEEFDSESAKFSIEEMIAAPNYQTFVGVIAGAEVVDKHTLNVKTKTPTGVGLLALAMGSYQFPKQYYSEVGKDVFGNKPYGTGPYTLVNWVKDSQVTLEANLEYWGGPPSIKTVIFRNIPEGSARIAALEAGDVDLIVDVPLDAVERLESTAGLNVAAVPGLRMYNLTLSTLPNLTDSPLTDPKVRKAIGYALDVDTIVDTIFSGRATHLANQPLSPVYFGHNPNLQPIPYDPEKAKQLLAEAGYPDGFEVTFKYPAGRYVQDKEVSQAIAGQLSKVGIRTNQVVLEPGTFLDQLNKLELNDMYFSGSMPPPDAHFIFMNYLCGFVYSYHCNEEYTAMWEEAAATVDPEERRQIYWKMLDNLIEDPPAVPLYYVNDHYAYRDNVVGFVPWASGHVDVYGLSVK